MSGRICGFCQEEIWSNPILNKGKFYHGECISKFVEMAQDHLDSAEEDDYDDNRPQINLVANKMVFNIESTVKKEKNGSKAVAKGNEVRGRINQQNGN